MVRPNKIFDISWGFARSWTLASAVELDVFTHIAAGRRTVKDIAQAVKASERGMEMLLNALVGLELLTKDENGCYNLIPDAENFLVSTKPGYLGPMCMHVYELNEAWSHLAESVRTGEPYIGSELQAKEEEFFAKLVKALFNVNYPAAKYAASYIKNKGKVVSNILDVAAGSAVWGIGFAEVFGAAKLTAIDFPKVCGVAAEYAKNFGVADRFECIAGDLRVVDFASQRYDVIILGNICHSEGRIYAEKLIKRSYTALKKGGFLLIAEFIPNDEKAGPVMPLLFALNMLVNTDEGDVFTIAEFRNWLAGCGFSDIEILDKAPSQSPLILAAK